MNCRKVNHLLSAYMDGELPGVEHRLIYEHLARCSECAGEYEGLLHMKRLLAAMRLREPKPQLQAHILSQVHQMENIIPQRRPFHWFDPLLDLCRITVPPKYVILGASLAIAAGILLRSQPMDDHRTILWQSAASDLAQEPAPDSASLNQRNPLGSVLPLQNVSLSYDRMYQPMMPHYTGNYIAPRRSALPYLYLFRFPPR